MLRTLNVSELAKFAVVGVAASAAHYLLLFAGVEWLAISPVIANGFAFLTALLVTYSGQSLWVFRAQSNHGLGQATRFSVSVAAGFLANVAIMFAATKMFGLDYRIGFLFCLATVPALSFLVNKLWVFRAA